MRKIIFALLLLSAVTAEANCGRFRTGYAYADRSAIYMNRATVYHSCRVYPGGWIYWGVKTLCTGQAFRLRVYGKTRTCRVTRLRFY